MHWETKISCGDLKPKLQYLQGMPVNTMTTILILVKKIALQSHKGKQLSVLTAQETGNTTKVDPIHSKT
jgi:hypothetical protein